jgi:hypothetical protein
MVSLIENGAIRFKTNTMSGDIMDDCVVISYKTGRNEIDSISIPFFISFGLICLKSPAQP